MIGPEIRNQTVCQAALLYGRRHDTSEVTLKNSRKYNTRRASAMSIE